MSDDLVNRLRRTAPGGIDWCTLGFQFQMKRLLNEAADEIERLRTRLEMGWGYDTKGNRVPMADCYDGIYCRDETIKLLEDHIKDLKKPDGA